MSAVIVMIGMFAIGLLCGVFLMAALVAASNADDAMEEPCDGQF